MAKRVPKQKDDTFYLMQAAKMVVWHVDINERVIYVPQNELEAAFDTMMVKHLCEGYNFHVQSCIPDEAPTKKDLYDPALTTKKVQVQKEGQISPYKAGEFYRVVSTHTLLKIVRTENKKVELAYMTQVPGLPNRSNLLISFEQMETQLRKGILKPETIY